MKFSSYILIPPRQSCNSFSSECTCQQQRWFGHPCRGCFILHLSSLTYKIWSSSTFLGSEKPAPGVHGGADDWMWSVYLKTWKAVARWDQPDNLQEKDIHYSVKATFVGCRLFWELQKAHWKALLSPCYLPSCSCPSSLTALCTLTALAPKVHASQNKKSLKSAFGFTPTVFS